MVSSLFSNKNYPIGNSQDAEFDFILAFGNYKSDIHHFVFKVQAIQTVAFVTQPLICLRGS